jgi:TolB protein
MRSKLAFFLVVVFLFTFTCAGFFSPVNQTVVRAQDQNLQDRLGRIVVNPGGLQRLGIADFLSRAGVVEANVNTFNEVLLNDLKFAGILDIVGKSLYPKKGLATPAELKTEEWAGDPSRLDYLAFGQIQNEGVQAYLYDVKTKTGLIEKTYRVDNNATIRKLAHQFADEILKKLFNIDGIANSKIAYTTGSNIMMMDYDGFGQRTLVRDGSYAILPSLSPDGSRLAYISYKSGRPSIEVHSASDGLPYSFASFPRGTVSSPQFSPDSAQMVFSSSKDSDAMEIYVSTADGNRARRLTNNSGIIDTSPRWNPKTGSEIAFISDRSGNPQIYIMDSNGTNVRRVLNDGGLADAPSWSPDGQFIAYTWRPPGAGQSDIFILDPVSGQKIQLTHGNGSNEAPVWAPDSRHIAFQSKRTGRWEVFIMNIDGTNQIQVSKGGGRSPAWSR